METSADRADSEKRGDDLHDRSALFAESGHALQTLRPVLTLTTVATAFGLRALQRRFKGLLLQQSNKSHLRIQGIDLASVFFLAGTSKFLPSA
jgi:hypothetical protein